MQLNEKKEDKNCHFADDVTKKQGSIKLLGYKITVKKSRVFHLKIILCKKSTLG